MVTKDTMHEGNRADYKAMLEKVDEGVGMIFAELEKQGVLDNTLVVLSSDNGGERYSDNTPLFHHKATLWEGGIRVPCLMRWPAKLPKGKSRDAGRHHDGPHGDLPRRRRREARRRLPAATASICCRCSPAKSPRTTARCSGVSTAATASRGPCATASGNT